MSDLELEQLTLDTLHGRRLRVQGCFVENLAGQELRVCSAEALPVVESVLRETVEPAISRAAANETTFLGLMDLLAAYLLIAARSDPRRAVQFLGAASEPLMVKSLRSMGTSFSRKGDVYVFGVAPPPEFRAFVQKATASASDAIRSIAERVEGHVTWAS